MNAPLSESPTRKPPASPPAVPVRLFTHPYVLILFGAALNVAAELFLKQGSTSALASGMSGIFGFAAIGSLWTWLGIACKVVSLLAWLWILRTVAVGVAFTLMNAVYVLVPLGAYFFLHEPISLWRWIGILLVLAGAAVIVRPLVAAEEML